MFGKHKATHSIVQIYLEVNEKMRYKQAKHLPGLGVASLISQKYHYFVVFLPVISVQISILLDNAATALICTLFFGILVEKSTNPYIPSDFQKL